MSDEPRRRRAPPSSAARASSNDRRAIALHAALAWAAAASVLLSTQYLSQLWVWENWPVADVFVGWLYQLRDKVVIALPIALLVWLATRLRAASLKLHALLLAAAVALGALAGEALAHLWLGVDNGVPAAWLVARWSLISLAVVGMFYTWRGAAEARARWHAETVLGLQAQQQLAQMQLIALRNQIEPHFLFNTLATVRRLQRTEPNTGALVLAHFIDYLRRALPMLEQPEVPLAQELALLRAYLAVIVVRMSGRLQASIDVPAALESVALPPLALAMLVENAIKHGLAPDPQGGSLCIRGRVHEGKAEIAVEDTGVGFSAEHSGGGGVGLANVRARLRTMYGPAGMLRLERNLPRGVRAVISVPLP